MFLFHSPWFLLLFLPLLGIPLFRLRNRARCAAVFSDLRRLKEMPASFAAKGKPLLEILPYLAFSLLILALARPQSGREDHRAEVEGIAIMMCIDRSGSMQAVDFQYEGRWMTRLEVVKKTFRDFVLGTDRLPGRPNDKIGLIAFGGYVDSFCPLTLDHATLIEMLENVRLVEAPKDHRGRDIPTSFINEERLTAIGDALVEAVSRLKDVEAKSKIIILLSDGEQTAGIATPLEGAQTANAFGIKVYTIGIGSTGSAAFVEKDMFGRDQVSHQPVVLDLRTLHLIAQETDGVFFNAENTHALEKVYAQIDQLEKTVMEGRVYTKFNEHYHSFLVPGFVLLLVYIVLSTTRFREIPG